MNADTLIPITLITLVPGIIVILFIVEHKRNKALSALAERLKMDYTKKPTPTASTSYTPFTLFNQGHSRKMSNLMERSLGGTSSAYFEYRYVTGGGKNSATHQQSVVSVSNPAIHFPQFILGPETFFDRVVQKFKGEDINFDAFPEFSKMFKLQGSDEAEIRRFFSDDIIRMLESCAGLNIETSGNRIIFYKKNRRCSVKQIEAFICDSLETYQELTKKTETP